MTEYSSDYRCPSVLKKSEGAVRKIGFELEFSGLDIEQAVDVLVASTGATVKSTTAAECSLYSDALGQFTVELDWDYLKRKAAEEAREEDGGKWLDAMTTVAGLLVPLEIVCPPVPVTRLHELDSLVQALRDAGAVGTDKSIVAAYGTHINVEIPNLDAASIIAYVRAFCLLQWWLVEAHQVDMTRKASFYINLYSDAYVKQVLSKSEISMDEIFADYLTHNASRNRALDLLPLLSEIDHGRIKAKLNDEKITARPTLHYRLPDCRIERDDWFLSEPWNIWWTVEELAARPADIAELGAEYLAAESRTTGVKRGEWVKFIDQWLKRRKLA